MVTGKEHQLASHRHRAQPESRITSLKGAHIQGSGEKARTPLAGVSLVAIHALAGAVLVVAVAPVGALGKLVCRVVRYCDVCPSSAKRAATCTSKATGARSDGSAQTGRAARKEECPRLGTGTYAGSSRRRPTCPSICTRSGRCSPRVHCKSLDSGQTRWRPLPQPSAPEAGGRDEPFDRPAAQLALLATSDRRTLSHIRRVHTHTHNV